MKTLIVSAAVVSFMAAAVRADLVIESNVESPQMNTPMTTKIKGDKVRTDMNGGPIGAMSVIMDNRSGDSINLMHAGKIAMKTSGAQMKQTLEMAKQLSGAPAGTPAKPQKSSQSEKIGDYDCDIYTWSGGTMTARYWVAKNHPQAAMLKDAEKKMNAGVLGAAQSGPDTTTLPGPVLKTETVTSGQTTTVTVVSVKEEKLDDKDFETPAEYKAVAMPQIPGFGGDGAGRAPAPVRPAAPGAAPAGGGAPPAPGAK